MTRGDAPAGSAAVAVQKRFAAIVETTKLPISLKGLVKILEENSNKWDSYTATHQFNINKATKVIREWNKQGSEAIGSIIRCFCGNDENGSKKSKNAEPAKKKEKTTPLVEIPKLLYPLIALFEELATVAIINAERELTADEQEIINKASAELAAQERRAIDPFTEIICMVAEYEAKDGGSKSKCVEFILKNHESEIALSILSRMTLLHTVLLVSHTEIICQIVDELMTTNGLITPDTGTAQLRRFLGNVIQLLPKLVPACEQKHKYKVYRMLLHIVDGSKELITDIKQISLIWEALQFGIDDEDSYARCAAYDAFIYCATHFRVEIAGQMFKYRFYLSLLKVMENYCRGVREGTMHLEDGNDKRLFKALNFFGGKLGVEFETHLPETMERLLNAMNPSEVERTNELVLSAIAAMYEIAEECHMEPHLPKLMAKLKKYLMNMVGNNANVVSMPEMATAIGNRKFGRLFVSIALKLFDETKCHEMRANLYTLLDAVSEKPDFDVELFLPKMVIRMMTTVRNKEDEAAANLYVEKAQAIKSLKLVAMRTGPAFGPYIQSCFNAIYSHLNHPQEVIRQAAVEALTQFVMAFHQLKKVERAHELAAKMIPDFAKMLKSEIAPTVAVSIMSAFRKLLTQTEDILKKELTEVLYNCLCDVLRGQTACQAASDFFEHKALIDEALHAFQDFSKAMPPSESAVHFDGLLPILREKLEDAKQTDAANPNHFRNLVYSTLLESIRELRANASSSFDMLFPLFSSGMQAAYHRERLNAVQGFGELLLHSKEKAIEKAAEATEEMHKLLTYERSAEVLDAASGLIARLMLDKSPVTPVERFLPHFIDKLDVEGRSVQYEHIYKCFQKLLIENNEVLITSLEAIVLLAFKRLRHELNWTSYEAIREFLKECRNQYGHIIDQAIVGDSHAADIVLNL